MSLKLTPYNQRMERVNATELGASEVIQNLPNPTTIGLLPAGGTSRIEYTLDKTLNNWQAWPKGNVAVYTEDILVGDVAGIRVYVESGTASMFIVGGVDG